MSKFSSAEKHAVMRNWRKCLHFTVAPTDVTHEVTVHSWICTIGHTLGDFVGIVNFTDT